MKPIPKHKHKWVYFMMFPVGCFYCSICDAVKDVNDK